MSGRLDIRDLSAGYGIRPAVVNLTAGPWTGGEIVAIVGPNGSGKSTLLRAIAGLVRTSGAATLSGRELLTLTARERASMIAYVPQDTAASASLLVLEATAVALRVTSPDRHGSRKCERHALAALDRVGIADLAFKPLGQLSGGQRQLAAFAQIIARPTPLVLLDEPTSALDLRAQLEVMEVIRGIARGGAVVIVVLHDLALAARLADRMLVLHRGTVHSEGSLRQTMTTAMLAAVYGVDARIGMDTDGFVHVAARRPLPVIRGESNRSGAGDDA